MTDLEIIDAIEQVRSKNNINWMNILRLAFKHSPSEAREIVAKINAFFPNPGCWFDLNGARIKVIKAKEVINDGKPGTILDKKFTIACSHNSVQILELKKEGKQKLTTEEFLKGNEISIGQKLT